jgi:hypothetical protein
MATIMTRKTPRTTPLRKDEYLDVVWDGVKRNSKKKRRS